MPHIMLDLETLGTAPGSVILSLGSCVFDENGPLAGDKHRFHMFADLKDSVADGLKMDASTVLWWMHPDRDAARLAMLAGQRQSEALYTIMIRFRHWLTDCAPDDKTRFIWGKGPSFDCGLLAAAYREKGPDLPWRYSNERCVRTLAAAFPHIAEPAREGTHHSALDDALHQARHIGAILKALGGKHSADSAR